MRIIDAATNQEIFEPDLTAGYVTETKWASPEAYATIDNVTKFALADEDWETVQLYMAYTPEDFAEFAEGERLADKQEVMDSLPDAMADLSLAVSNGAADTAELADALADLSAIVSTLMEGQANG